MFDFIAVIPFGLLIGFVAASAIPLGSQRGCIATLLLSVTCGGVFGALVLSSTNAIAPAASTAFFAICGAILGILIRFALERK